MNDLKELKVGDRIFKTGTVYELPRILTVERVTKTQAISGNYRFRLKYISSIECLGRPAYSRIWFRLATDEDVEEVEKAENVARLRKVNFSTLTNKQIKQILKIIE